MINDVTTEEEQVFRCSASTIHRVVIVTRSDHELYGDTHQNPSTLIFFTGLGPYSTSMGVIARTIGPARPEYSGHRL